MKKINLEKQKIAAPFQVSEDYFDKLESRIQDRVRGDRKREVYLPVLKWATVPTLLVIFAIGYLIIPNQENPSSSELIAQLSSSEILDYLEYTDINEYDIAGISGSPDLLLDGEDMIENIDLENNDLDQILDQFDLELNIEEI